MYKRLIFLLRMSAIGDVIIATRTCAILHQNGYFPVFVTSPAMRDILLRTTELNAFVCIEGDAQPQFWYDKKPLSENEFAQKLESLQAEKKSVVLDLQKTARSQKAFKTLQGTLFGSTLKKRLSVKKRTGYRFLLVLRSFFSFRQKSRSPLHIPSIVTTHRLQENLLNVLFSQDQKTYADFSLEKNILERGENADTFLKKQGLNLNSKYICVFPGSSGHIKSWSKENFRALIGLILNTTSFSVFIMGSQQEEYLGEYLSYPKHERLMNIVNTTTLGETLDLLAGAHHVFTNDSFAAHAADAYHVAATVIFGSTTPQFGFVPLFEKIKIEYAHLSCSPCTRHGKNSCRFQNLRCFTEVSAQSVFAHLS